MAKMKMMKVTDDNANNNNNNFVKGMYSGKMMRAKPLRNSDDPYIFFILDVYRTAEECETLSPWRWTSSAELVISRYQTGTAIDKSNMYLALLVSGGNDINAWNGFVNNTIMLLTESYITKWLEDLPIPTPPP